MPSREVPDFLLMPLAEANKIDRFRRLCPRRSTEQFIPEESMFVVAEPPSQTLPILSSSESSFLLQDLHETLGSTRFGSLFMRPRRRAAGRC
jgi:hypothetical protein